MELIVLAQSFLHLGFIYLSETTKVESRAELVLINGCRKIIV